MKPLSAIVAGHICLDIYPDLSNLSAGQFNKSFIPGHLMNIGPLSFATGGAVSNTGLALHTLGIETRLMGKVGQDYLGTIVKEIIQSYSPSLVQGMVEDAQVSTSYTIVITPPEIDRYLLHCTGANDTFSSSDINTNLLMESDIFHFGYPPLMQQMYAADGKELAHVFELAKQTGITTSLDTAFTAPDTPAGQAHWHKILSATLPYVDIFMPSIEEMLCMLRRDEYNNLRTQVTDGDIIPLVKSDLLTSLSSELLEMGAKIVGLKLGSRGLFIRTASPAILADMGRARPSDISSWADQELWSPCYEVNVAGTAGSGDATIAGFLCAVLHDFSPSQAINAAVAVGACNVEAVDTLSGIKPWDETMERIAKGWPKKKLDLEANGWLYDSAQQVWARV